jgi:tetratricopeptide (TPR) repeat protein
VKLWEAHKNLAMFQAERRRLLDNTMLRWHREWAVGNERSQQWFAAAFHLSRLIEAEPADGSHHLRRGIALARLGRKDEAGKDFARARELDVSELALAEAYSSAGQWDDAATIFGRAVEARDATAPVWHRHALLCLRRGDANGYRKACAAMLERYGKTPGLVYANDVAWTCALAPDAVADVAQAVTLARKAKDTAPRDYVICNTLGALLYRANQPDAAIEHLNEAIKLHGQGGTVADWLFLAMAHHQNKHANEARSWLDKAVLGITQAKGLPWTRQLEYELLQREAESLIKPSMPPAEPKPSPP